MSTRTTGAIICLTFTALLCAFPSAQTHTAGEAKRYAQEGLSFEYPAGWALADKSNQQAQHLILTREGGSALVVVIAYRELITRPEQLSAASRNIWQPYAEDMARKLGITKTPPWQETQCLKISDRPAVGVRLGGQVNAQPTTGEVYGLMLGRRYVSVFFVRPDAEEEQAGAAWKAVLDSLKVEEPANLPPLQWGDTDIVMGGVINGKAIKKPQPEYPSIARSARASGVVSVQIMVDENGDVTSADAVSGHPLLRESAVRAALKAKFSPTKLCGEPVKVSGVITYGFMLH